MPCDECQHIAPIFEVPIMSNMIVGSCIRDTEESPVVVAVAKARGASQRIEGSYWLGQRYLSNDWTGVLLIRPV